MRVEQTITGKGIIYTLLEYGQDPRFSGRSACKKSIGIVFHDQPC